MHDVDATSTHEFAPHGHVENLFLDAFTVGYGGRFVSDDLLVHSKETAAAMRVPFMQAMRWCRCSLLVSCRNSPEWKDDKESA